MKNILMKYVIPLIMIFQLLHAGDGSVYTRHGLGDVYFNFSARRLGMGGLGISVPDRYNLSTLNPANWYMLEMTRLEVGVDYRGLQMSDQSGSAFFPEYAFSGFLLGFPIERELGITVVTGLVPATRVNYRVVENVTSGIEDYTATYSGSGGLSKLFLGASYKTPIDVVIGASFEYYSGGIDYTSEIDFADFSDYRDASFTKNLDFRGMGANLGIISNDIAALIGLETITDWRIALNLHLMSKMNTDTALTIINPNGETVPEVGLVKTKYPVKIGVGTSFILSEKYLFLVDYLYQPWTDFRFDGLPDQNLRDLHAVSIGFEYSNPVSQFASFWEQIVLRGGLSLAETQYELNNTAIREIGIHAGIAFPLSPANTIDVGFKFGTRGTTGAGLVKENIYRLSVTLSFGELWFQREER